MTVGLRKKTLLVVEDNQPVQDELQRMGVEAAFDVAGTASGKQAFELIRRRRFDAALVDMRLVEGNKENKEGLDILRHLSELDEGTVSALLTGYGDFGDAAKAQLYGAQAIEKGTPDFNETVQRLLRRVADLKYTRLLVPARAWSGQEHPDLWSFQTNSILRPKGDYGVTLSLLHELLVTCDPILERADSHGLAKLPNDPALAGLYWSRGLGEAVVVVVAHEDVPSPIPLLPHWPAVTIQQEMYRTSRKNLIGAIFICSGVGPEDFPTKRAYVE